MKKSLLFSSLLFMSIILYAQWQQTNGPSSSSIYSISIIDNKIFAGTNKGIFLSENNGSSWKMTNIESYSYDANSFVMCNNKIFVATEDGVYIYSNSGYWQKKGLDNVTSLAVIGKDIFAGTNDEGIFVSKNDGITWSPINDWIRNYKIWALKSVGSTIYAGTNHGVLYSINSGLTWSDVNISMIYTDVISLAIVGNNIYAGTLGKGIYLSSNNGISWSMINTGLTDLNILSLNSDGNKILAGTKDGMFISVNSGANWSKINSGLPQNIFVNSIALNNQFYFVGTNNSGMYMSTNGGNNFYARNTGLAPDQVNCIFISGNTIFAGTNKSVYYTNDDGDNWVNTGINLATYSIRGIENKIYAGTVQGIYLSTDNGINWAAKNNGCKHGVLSLAVEGNKIIIGTYEGVFLSTNNGTSWISSNNGLPSNSVVNSLVINGNSIYAGTDYCIYQSTDNCSSWIQLGLGNCWMSVLELVINGNDIFAGTDLYGIFYSPNKGTSWYQTVMKDVHILSLLFYQNILFASLNWGEGIYYSKTKGASWSYLGLQGNSNIFALAIKDNIMYAGLSGNLNYPESFQGGVWKRSIGGVLSEDNLIENKNFQIFPNPASDVIFIDSKNDCSKFKITVCNTLGKVVKSEILKNGHNELFVGDLLNGIYFITIHLNGEILTHKIIIQK